MKPTSAFVVSRQSRAAVTADVMAPRALAQRARPLIAVQHRKLRLPFGFWIHKLNTCKLWVQGLPHHLWHMPQRLKRGESKRTSTTSLTTWDHYRKLLEDVDHDVTVDLDTVWTAISILSNHRSRTNNALHGTEVVNCTVVSTPPRKQYGMAHELLL
jgi:hypothetical protein